VSTWRMAGTYLEACNCEPGCGCNFVGSPNSPEGNCEALLAHAIDEGSASGVDLGGAKVVWALWWPGAIHERNGHGHAFVDCKDEAQFEALSRIWRGEKGYPFFEIFNSTFDEPSAVDRATINMTLDGKSSRYTVEGVGEVALTPLRSPVSGEQNDVRIVKPEGFIWKDGSIGTSERLHVELPEMNFDVSGRHTVYAEFDYAVV
jgi:hypothetical protein